MKIKQLYWALVLLTSALGMAGVQTGNADIEEGIVGDERVEKTITVKIVNSAGELRTECFKLQVTVQGAMGVDYYTLNDKTGQMTVPVQVSKDKETAVIINGRRCFDQGPFSTMQGIALVYDSKAEGPGKATIVFPNY